jgi:hypothetical protein
MLDTATIETHVPQFAITELMQCEDRGPALAVGHTRGDPIVDEIPRTAQDPFKVELRSCQHSRDCRSRPAKHEHVRRQQYRGDGGDDCCDIKSIHEKLHGESTASVAAELCMG